jgi:lipid II:glycine glycyltransferase (peptidoglycan interpeptide bridge formation enzyme)
MNVYEIDPMTDARWDHLLQSHPQASIFHTRGWLEALHRTYGYTPVAFTTSPPEGPLTNGIPFCAIKGIFGKRRLVSLPFSDHCEPLVESNEQLNSLLPYLQQKRDSEGWDYIEVRPRTSIPAAICGFGLSQGFWFHELDLRRNLDELFHNTHKDCIQRKLRRAEREGLDCKQGTSVSLLQQFYQLLIETRRRHGLPTQPVEWFRNLIDCLGVNLTIRVASNDGRPVAGLLTIRHKQTLVYKYGCSDKRFSSLGGMQFLFWNTIQDAKNDLLSELDMGRSDYANSGLTTFKDRWGATRTELTYLQYPLRSSQRNSERVLSKYVWRHVPDCVFTAAGRVLYRHMG